MQQQCWCCWCSAAKHGVMNHNGFNNVVTNTKLTTTARASPAKQQQLRCHQDVSPPWQMSVPFCIALKKNLISVMSVVWMLPLGESSLQRRSTTWQSFY
jgi:hypothetical protein